MARQLTETQKEKIRSDYIALMDLAHEKGYWVMFTHYHRNKQRSRTCRCAHKKTTEKEYCATTCILIRDGSVVSRGASVCSFQDQPWKVEGRRLSLVRALYAIHNADQLERLPSNGAEHINLQLCKSELAPRFTVIEKERLKRMGLLQEKIAG